MKTKDLKDILKIEANKINIPDYSENILAKVDYNTKPVADSSCKRKKSTRIIIPSLTGFVTVLAIIILVLFINFKSTEVKPSLTRGKELIGKEIFVAGNLVDSNSSKLSKFSQKNSDILYDDAKFIHDYLIIGEMMFEQDNIEISVYENNDSNYKEYDYLMQVRYKVETEYFLDYDFYYNETQKNNYKNDEKESNSTFEGIMLIGDIEYVVNGEKEIEDDEYETTTRIFTSSESYIEIKQETEINENEYSYIFYENNRKIKELKQSIEIEDNNKEMEIELKDFSTNISKELQFKYLNNYIYCEYEREINEEEVEIELKIYEYADYYEYHFNEDQIYKIYK